MQPILIQSEQAEEAIVAAMLLNEAVCVDMVSRLTPLHFASLKFRDMFSTISKLVTNGQPVDVVTVPDAGAGKFSQSDVMELFMIHTSAANAEQHFNILVDKFHRRNAYQIAHALINQVESTDDIVATVQEAQNQLSMMGDVSEYDDGAGTMVAGVMSILEAITDGTMEHEPCIPTLPWLDTVIGGFYPGKMYYIAGVTSHGKSAITLQIAKATAQAGYRTDVSSLEMKREEIGKRVISEEAGVPLLPTFQHGVRLTPEQIRRVAIASDTITGLQLRIDDRRGYSVMHYRAKLQKAKIEGDPIRVLVIDYLSLMRLGNEENKNQRVEAAVQQLQVLAGEFNLPIVVVSQLSRDMVKRAEKRPQLSDLRDSGAIEQTADCVIFVYDDPDSEQDSQARKRDTIIDVQKNRGGDTGAIPTTFDRPIQRFKLREVR